MVVKKVGDFAGPSVCAIDVLLMRVRLNVVDELVGPPRELAQSQWHIDTLVWSLRGPQLITLPPRREQKMSPAYCDDGNHDPNADTQQEGDPYLRLELLRTSR